MAKIGRNDPCPCGSGKKYKRCCQNAAANPIGDLKAALQAHGDFADKAEVSEFIEAWNQRPAKDGNDGFQGLTPNQVHDLIYSPFQSSHLISFGAERVEDDDAPAMIILSKLLEAIGEQGLKPTATGNLPRNLCRDIAFSCWGETLYQAKTKFAGINSENDFHDLHKVRIVAEQAGMIRKYNGRFIVSKKTRQVIADQGCGALYPEFFRTFVDKFNWAYEDRFPELRILQESFAFTLFLFQRYGDEFRPVDFYGELMLDAFPPMVGEAANDVSPMRNPEHIVKHCYETRVIIRSLCFLGLLEAKQVNEIGQGMPVFDVRRRPFMEQVVRFDETLLPTIPDEPQESAR